MDLKGNSRKGIKNPFELAKVRIIGVELTDVDCTIINSLRNNNLVQKQIQN